MEKYRIGNDIKVKWVIFRNGKKPEDFTKATIQELRLNNVTSGDSLLPTYSVSGNVITVEYPASQQKEAGVFTLTLKYTKKLSSTSTEDQYTIDKENAFEIVAQTRFEESDPEIPGVIESFVYRNRDGKDGSTPDIGKNENWWIDGKDTGKPSRGRKFESSDFTEAEWNEIKKPSLDAAGIATDAAIRCEDAIIATNDVKASTIVVRDETSRVKLETNAVKLATEEIKNQTEESKNRCDESTSQSITQTGNAQKATSEAINSSILAADAAGKFDKAIVQEYPTTEPTTKSTVINSQDTFKKFKEQESKMVQLEQKTNYYIGTYGISSSEIAIINKAIAGVDVVGNYNNYITLDTFDLRANGELSIILKIGSIRYMSGYVQLIDGINKINITSTTQDRYTDVYVSIYIDKSKLPSYFAYATGSKVTDAQFCGLNIGMCKVYGNSLLIKNESDYITSPVISSFKEIELAIKTIELQGMWRDNGVYISLFDYSRSTGIINLAFKNKNNTTVATVNKTLTTEERSSVVTLNIIPNTNYLNKEGCIVSGSITIDFSKLNVLQVETKVTFREGAIKDLNKQAEFGYIGDYEVITDANALARGNRALAADNTEVAYTGNYISKLIPVQVGQIIIYVGSYNLSQSYNIAHILDENQNVIEMIQSTQCFIKEMTITNDKARYIKFTCNQDNSANFKIINKTKIKRADVVSREILASANQLNVQEGVNFDGTKDTSGNYLSTDFIRVAPNSTLSYVGYLRYGASVVLYDCNYRVIKGCVLESYTSNPVRYGVFKTTNDTMYVRISAHKSCFGDATYPFIVEYISKNTDIIYDTFMQGCKSGEQSFKLSNGLIFNRKADDVWEDIIQFKKNLTEIYSYPNSHTFKSDFKIKSISQQVGYLRINGLTIEKKEGEIWVKKIDISSDTTLLNIKEYRLLNNDMYLFCRAKAANYSSYEEVVYRVGDFDLISQSLPKVVLTLPHYGTDTYTTVSWWGISSYKNIVIFSDYGTQRVNGHVWISEDSGNTFRMILDIYSLSPAITSGHIHGSCYDPYFDRIWVTTGDGVNNTFVLWSDDRGVTWQRTQCPFRSTITQKTYKHIQFTQPFVEKDYVLFMHDSPRAGIWRYNRGNKSDIPTFEWAIDVTDHSVNQMDNETTQLAGLTIHKSDDGIIYAAISWHDNAAAANGAIGSIVATKDGYNWARYKDVINPDTNRGYINPNNDSILVGNDYYIVDESKNKRLLIQ